MFVLPSFFDEFVSKHGESVRQDYQNALVHRRENRKQRAIINQRLKAETQAIKDLLPEQTCVLDIETSGVSTKSFSVTLVGVKTYQIVRLPDSTTISATHYVPQHYYCFGPDDGPRTSTASQHFHFGTHAFEMLEGFLRDFPGPVVGHNIFEFDYRFLDSLVDLRGIVEKSVDTLHFAWERSGKDLLGLSLDNLSAAGRGKTRLPPRLPRQAESDRRGPQSRNSGRKASTTKSLRTTKTIVI